MLLKFSKFYKLFSKKKIKYVWQKLPRQNQGSFEQIIILMAEKEGFEPSRQFPTLRP